MFGLKHFVTDLPQKKETEKRYKNLLSNFRLPVQVASP